MRTLNKHSKEKDELKRNNPYDYLIELNTEEMKGNGDQEIGTDLFNFSSNINN